MNAASDDLRTRLGRLGLGRLAYQFWHRPLEPLRASLAAGGPWQQRKTESGRRAMEAAAFTLPPLPTPAPGVISLEVHLLTGRRFWYQTAFCLWTFSRHTARPLAPVIYDDGTLEPVQCEALARLFPHTRFVAQSETLARLDEQLPAARFPMLRDRWKHYPNIRKLIDPHLGGTGWKLVLDSDLLFFRRPGFLLHWLENPGRPLHAVDCETAYGYSASLLATLAPAPLADRVNVGLCGLKSDELDWEHVENLCARLIGTEGPHYYLEQALVALLVAGRSCDIAPAHDYVTLPRPPEARSCNAVMHHYVAGSKRWYFQSNWLRALTP